MKYWLGIVTQEHVQRGLALGIVQIGHGKHTGLARLHQGDGFVYYSPAPAQAFTAIGTVPDEELWQADDGDFKPWRRKFAYAQARPAPIRSLLEQLSFTAGNANWGYQLRRGLIEITADDFTIIARSMKAKIDPS